MSRATLSGVEKAQTDSSGDVLSIFMGNAIGFGLELSVIVASSRELGR
jgi:hypothetical protein